MPGGIGSGLSDQMQDQSDQYKHFMNQANDNPDIVPRYTDAPIREDDAWAKYTVWNKGPDGLLYLEWNHNNPPTGAMAAQVAAYDQSLYDAYHSGAVTVGWDVHSADWSAFEDHVAWNLHPEQYGGGAVSGGASSSPPPIGGDTSTGGDHTAPGRPSHSVVNGGGVDIPPTDSPTDAPSTPDYTVYYIIAGVAAVAFAYFEFVKKQ